MLWSYIDPHDRAVWWMETAPIFIAAPLLFFSRKRFPLTPLLYVAIWCHAVVLAVGGHYTYAEVPLFDWIRDSFGLSRNHYDRLGHFMQGAVPALVARELLIRTSPMKAGKWLFTITVLSCLGISAIYEIIEWAAAVWSNDGAEAFLGTQGDVWDTQKDMLWAGIGAVVAQMLLSRWQDRQIAKA